MTIRTDATRLKLRPVDPRRPRAVAPRQGQVLMDTDLSQQSAHLIERIETESADSFGSPGRMVVPGGGGGFRITPQSTPDACGIGAGRGYLDGWQVESATACTLASQPHPRTDTAPVAPALIALKALVRHIDPVEEPAYADKGLGDAQAAGRTLVDWQVFPFAPAAGFGSSPGCATACQHPEWQKLIAPSTGTLTVVPDTAPPSSNPCSLTPQGGFSRGENLLYRIEVHGGVQRADYPSADGARFGLKGLKIKLSRGNAAVLVRITETSSTDVTVTPPALDPRNWFAPGLLAEFVSVHDDVAPPDPALEERLFRVARATATVVTLEPGAAAMAAKAKAGGWFLRLWDGFSGLAASGTETVDTTADPDVSQDIDLGDGLKVRIGGGASSAVFRRGDYWTFAARADGTIDWPPGATETPHGPEIRYAPLAVLKPTATPEAEDCRIRGATLTDRVLLYRGGDGQQANPNPLDPKPVPLPSPLEVAVYRGQFPVAGALVRFTASHGQLPNGTTVQDVATADGGGNRGIVAAVEWSIAPNVERQECMAELLVGGQPVAGGFARVRFTATLAVARKVAYDPVACADLKSQKVSNVQDAIDALCRRSRGGGCCVTIGEGGDHPNLEVAIRKLLEQKKRRLCLCLLPAPEEPPPHTRAENVRVSAPEGTELLVRGAGPASRLVLDEAVDLSDFASVTLCDFDIVGLDRPVTLRFGGCEMVRLQGLRIGGLVEPGKSLLQIGATRSIEVSGCDLKAFTPRGIDKLASLLQSIQLLEPLRGALATADGELLRTIPRTVAEEFAHYNEGQRARLDEEVRAVQAGGHALELGVAQAEALEALRLAVMNRASVPHITAALDRVRTEFAMEGLNVALALDDAEADTLVADSRINGRVSLYGEASRRQPLSPGQLKALNTKIGNGRVRLRSGAGHLRLRNNRMRELDLGHGMLELLRTLASSDAAEGDVQGLYRSLVAESNTLHAVWSHWLAFDLGLGMNQFEPPAEQVSDIGCAIASQGKYVGNFAHRELRLFVAGHQPERFGNGGLDVRPA